jgi:hypothetical protein
MIPLDEKKFAQDFKTGKHKIPVMSKNPVDILPLQQVIQEFASFSSITSFISDAPAPHKRSSTAETTEKQDKAELLANMQWFLWKVFDQPDAMDLVAEILPASSQPTLVKAGKHISNPVADYSAEEKALSWNWARWYAKITPYLSNSIVITVAYEVHRMIRAERSDRWADSTRFNDAEIAMENLIEVIEEGKIAKERPEDVEGGGNDSE